MRECFTNNSVKIENIECFDLSLTLDCGQAFRWNRQQDGSWKGIAFGREIEALQNGNTITIKGTNKEDYETIWCRYFDLERDYKNLCISFCEDETMCAAIKTYPGIRILQQEPWEALCSFIISQNNNIPRIKGIIDRLCACFGDKLNGGGYSFPSAERLSGLTVEDLSPLRAGFRAKYMLDAAKKVSSSEVDLQRLGDMAIDEARTELIKIKGVGAKVAECTLLYGCGRMHAFPVDVWVKRVMNEIYPNGLPECILGNEGIAQQYLFHWRRNLK
ncbi:MAG TPA: DNA glycosylase [Clostridia bacterium]|nr:DNA glycosylase [Clostridia bacterium]